MNVHTVKLVSPSVKGVSISVDFDGLTAERLVDIAAAIDALKQSIISIGHTRLSTQQPVSDADDPSAPVIQPTPTQDSDTMWQGR